MDLPYKMRRIIQLVAFLTVCACSGKNQSSYQQSTPNGEVEVSGKTKDESPTDFRQADESVQIGGVNLTSDTGYSISASLVGPSGSTVIYTGTSSSADFKIKVRASGYLIVSATKDNKTLSAIVPPSFIANKNIKASVVLDQTTTIAAKLLTIVSNKATAGNVDAVAALSAYVVPVADLYVVASAVKRVVDKQIAENVAADPINLSTLATSLVSAAIKKADNIIVSMSRNDYAQKIAAGSYNTIYGSDAATVAPSVLSYRVNSGLGDSTAAKTDVAYEAIVASYNSFVNSAYRSEATIYRQAATNTTAGSNAIATSVSTVYDAMYSSCVASSATCVSAPYTPPASPESNTVSSSGGASSPQTASPSTTSSTTSIAVIMAAPMTQGSVSVSFSVASSSIYYVNFYSDASCATLNAGPFQNATSPIAATGLSSGSKYLKVTSDVGEASVCYGPFTVY